MIAELGRLVDCVPIGTLDPGPLTGELVTLDPETVPLGRPVNWLPPGPDGNVED